MGLITQLRTRTSDTILYATATGLESWRNLRHQQGGLLTDAWIAGHGPVRCETLFPRLASGRRQFSGHVVSSSDGMRLVAVSGGFDIDGVRTNGG